MRKFFNVGDIGDIAAALEEAREVKKNRFAWKHLGENRTIMLVFFNSSLRTRLPESGYQPGHEPDCAEHRPGELEA